MLANLPHHSTTLQGYATKIHTFNIQESTSSLDKWMSWSRWERGRAGNKKKFVSSCNLIGQRLKTKGSSFPVCSSKFDAFSFFMFDPITWFSKNTHSENTAVPAVWVAQWTMKTIPEFFQISIVLVNKQSLSKIGVFFKCTKLQSSILAASTLWFNLRSWNNFLRSTLQTPCFSLDTNN